RGPPRVDHRDAARPQVITHLAEELARRQVEGDVRLAVCVHHHDVVLARLRVEPVPRIPNDRVHVRLVEVEITMRDVEDVWVDLDPGDLNARAVRRGVLPPRGAAG